MIWNFIRKRHAMILLILFGIFPLSATAGSHECHLADTISQNNIPAPAPEYLPVTSLFLNGSRAQRNEPESNDLQFTAAENTGESKIPFSSEHLLFSIDTGGIFTGQIHKHAIADRAGPFYG